MSLNYADKLAFNGTIAEIMEQNQKEFEKLGFLVEKRIDEQKDKNEKAVEEDAKQEKMKAEVVKQTEITVAALNDAYVFASSNLDAMVGVLGKDSALAKRLRKLREQMHHNKKKE